MSGYPRGRRKLVKRAMAAANELDPELGLAPTDDPLDDEHQLVGVLNDLSRAPARLRALLEPVPDGLAMAERVLELRQLVGTGTDEKRGTFDVYMVMRAPHVVADETRERLIRAHYAAMASLLEEVGEPSLASEIASQAPMVCIERPLPTARHRDVEAALHEALADALRDAESNHPLFGLAQAAYGLAASYPIQRYVLWPAYSRCLTTPDPYRSAIALWAAGIGVRHRGSTIAWWSGP